jgi:adenosylcobinamide-GDP ribazoletransferase
VNLSSPLLAFGLLTVVPVRTASPTPRDLSRSVAFFPVVGLTLGLAAATIDWLLRTVLPAPVATVAVLAFLAVASGGLHWDGLADAADGLFAAGEPSRRLEIMRDSRVGAFGVAAVAFVLLFEYAALSSVTTDFRVSALVVAAVLSRWAMSFALWSAPPARADGLGAAFAQHVTLVHIAVASAVTGVIVGALASEPAAGVALLSAIGVAFAFSQLARVRVTGITGDTCGATGELVFACVLATFCLRAFAGG